MTGHLLVNSPTAIAHGIKNSNTAAKYKNGIVKIKSDTFLNKEEVTPRYNNVEEQ